MMAREAAMRICLAAGELDKGKGMVCLMRVWVRMFSREVGSVRMDLSRSLLKKVRQNWRVALNMVCRRSQLNWFLSVE